MSAIKTGLKLKSLHPGMFSQPFSIGPRSYIEKAMKNFSIIVSALVLSLIVSLSACDKPNTVLIRVENATGHDITEVFVAGPEDDHQYGDLQNGKQSPYQIYEKAYRYAFCTFKIGDAQFTIQPIDFVGESLLEPGEYTYRLMISDLETPWASMELVD